MKLKKKTIKKIELLEDKIKKKKNNIQWKQNPKK